MDGGSLLGSRTFLSQRSDTESYADIKAHLRTWDDLTIVHLGESVRIDGSGYADIARLTLLQILQERCKRCGIEIRFETRLPDASAFAEYDVIVGADGVNSVVRQQFAEQFLPSTHWLSNKYAWYGTHQRFDTLSLIFRSFQGGAFVAHCYPYSENTSTFIVECDAQTWAQAGFAQMSDAESRAYCERVFAEYLQGHDLLSNKSEWLNFRIVGNKVWSYRNVILLGDALRTVHFSVGSGTRMALEDAITLFQAITATDNVEAAFQRFKQIRRSGTEKMLDIAQQSYTWYEAFHEKMELDALPLAYNYMTRSGRIDDETLRLKAPHFMTSYQAYLSAKREA